LNLKKPVEIAGNSWTWATVEIENSPFVDAQTVDAKLQEKLAEVHNAVEDCLNL